MTPKKIIISFVFIIIFSYILTSCNNGDTYVEPVNGHGGTGTGGIQRDSLTEPFFKAYFAAASSYNHYPRAYAMDSIKTALSPIWNRDSIILGIRNPGFATSEALLNFNSVQTVKNYLYTYSLANNTFVLEFNYIHSFGTRTMLALPTGVAGFSLGYKYAFMGVGNLDSAINGLPSVCFTMTDYIRTIYTGQIDTLKINWAIFYTTIHEITHGRGLADMSGPADSVHFGHQNSSYTADNSCYMNNLFGITIFSSSYNYPPHLCYKHKQWVKDSLKYKIKTGLLIQ